MKIVLIDNYNRENVSDVLIAENVKEYWGKKIVKLLNDKEGENSENYFELKDDNYKLYKFEI